MDKFVVDKFVVETAYTFFHQKQRVYAYSNLDWQKDDIEYAIEQYVAGMTPELYEFLAKGRPGFLHDHTTFAADLAEAVDVLEGML